MFKKLLLFTLLSLLSFSSWADRIKILDKPEDAFQARMDLIESANEEIFISYFIFNKDDTSLQLLAALREKARNGVEVKIMIDGMFNSIPKYVGTHLLHEGVEIKNYNNFNIFKLGHAIKYRMHDKMFIVDREKVILGGRNIEDTYYDLAQKNYHDRDIYVEGETAEDSAQYFLDLWRKGNLKHFKQKRRLHRKRRAKKLNNAIALIDEQLEKLQSHKHLGLERSWNKDLVEVGDNVEFVHDPVAYRKKKVVGTAKKLYDLIANAKHTVIIDSPYFIMTKEMKKLFKKVINENKVKVRVLTNSLKATDGIVPQAAYIGQRKKIVKMGIELYEYFKKDCFHSKSIVIDNEIAVVGSFNFDPRSQNLNTETVAVVNDPTVAGLLIDSMDETVKEAQRINSKGRPEGQKHKLPGVKTGKKILTRLIQYLIVPLAKGLL